MAEPDSQANSVFEIDRIRELVELMKEHELSEIDLKQSDQRIRLARGPQGGFSAMATPVPPMPVPAAPAPSAGGASGESPAAASDANVVTINSPIVGTFYSRPNPNSEPYVRVGDVVEADTTVCMIEAMKVFNEIPAEIRGKIVAVLVDDEDPVEFGKPLFKVDTSQ